MGFLPGLKPHVLCTGRYLGSIPRPTDFCGIPSSANASTRTAINFRCSKAARRHCLHSDMPEVPNLQKYPFSTDSYHLFQSTDKFTDFYHLFQCRTNIRICLLRGYNSSSLHRDFGNQENSNKP